MSMFLHVPIKVYFNIVFTGSVDASELKAVFKEMEVNVTEQEINLLLKGMDKDKTLKVNWNEWREYHLLNPSGHSIHDIIQFWRHTMVSYTIKRVFIPSHDGCLVQSDKKFI